MLKRFSADERGSLVVAIGVMLVLATLSLGLLARSLSTLDSSRQTQDYNAALAVADRGLSDALYRIDQGAAATFTQTVSPSATESFTYTATRQSSTMWLVQSRASVNGVMHSVEARVVREVEYPYALFTDQTLDVNGNALGNVFSYDPSAPAVATGHAFVGSNGEIQVNGGGNVGDEQHWFVACTGCAHPVQLARKKALPPPTMPTVAESQACPTSNRFTGVVNGLGGRPFRCTGAVDFDDVTVTNGPMVVYVSCTGGGDATCADLSSASVNVGGRAKDFQLYVAGAGVIQLRNADYKGLVYAPDANARINGGHMTAHGSLTLDEIRVNGGPNFNIAYEDSIRDVALTRWQVIDYTEIPS